MLKRNKFSNRKASISQVVPENWYNLALQDSSQIRTCFQSLDVDHVIAVDETFIRFHENEDSILAPLGSKRVASTARPHDSKSGITLVVAADLTTSSLLPPFIIATAKFGGTLMKEWAQYSNSAVIFNESHWMTQKTAIIFLHWLTLQLPKKSIGKIRKKSNTNLIRLPGLVWDRSSTHFGPDIDIWLSEHSSNSPHRIHMRFISEGMTSIMQVTHVTYQNAFI